MVGADFVLPNAWLTGTGSRRLEGTNSGHKNAEGMPAVGVRVEPPVRLGRAVETGGVTRAGARLFVNHWLRLMRDLPEPYHQGKWLSR